MAAPLTESIGTSFSEAYQVVGRYLPSVVAAVGIALIGWLAAALLRKATRYLATRTQERLDQIDWLQTRTQQVPAYRTAPALVAGVVFWMVLLFFLVAAVEALGLPAVSSLLGRVTTYLPRVLAAVIIMLAGFLAGDVALNLVSRGLAGMGVAYGEALARCAQVLIIVVAAIIGIEQLGIDSTVLTLALSITFGTTLGAAALAFGLGARSTVANMVAVQQITRIYQVGDTVGLGDVEGRIVEITQTAVLVEGSSGRVMIPGQRFSDEVSIRVSTGQ